MCQRYRARRRAHERPDPSPGHRSRNIEVSGDIDYWVDVLLPALPRPDVHDRRPRILEAAWSSTKTTSAERSSDLLPVRIRVGRNRFVPDGTADSTILPPQGRGSFPVRELDVPARSKRKVTFQGSLLEAESEDSLARLVRRGRASIHLVLYEQGERRSTRLEQRTLCWKLAEDTAGDCVSDVDERERAD